VAEDTLSEIEKYHHHVVNSLHNWSDPEVKNHWNPHTFQLQALKAIFVSDCKNVFIQCGRKWGKTETIVYALWRFALLNPNTSNYYLCPLIKQAKEIIWDARDTRGRYRLKEFGPKEFISYIDESELRIVFKNGSFIKVDGSDNYNAWAGISPHFLVLDEYADFNPKFYPVMDPNRATFDAPVVIIGTPPEEEFIDKDTLHPYVELARDFQKEMFLGGQALYLKRPSWDNPNPVIQKFLKRTRQSLERRGKMHEWYRMYCAELVRSGENKVFPHFIANPQIQGSQVYYQSDIIKHMYFSQGA